MKLIDHSYNVNKIYFKAHINDKNDSDLHFDS